MSQSCSDIQPQGDSETVMRQRLDVDCPAFRVQGSGTLGQRGWHLGREVGSEHDGLAKRTHRAKIGFLQ